MTLVKMNEVQLPGLTRQEQEIPNKEYKGFSVTKDTKDEHLFTIKNDTTGDYLPGKFSRRRNIEDAIDNYLSRIDVQKRFADIEHDRTNQAQD